MEKDKSEIFTPVTTAELHKAIRIGGRTESTINKIKIPELLSMGFNKTDLLFLIYVKGQDKPYRLPSTGVNFSI